MPASQIECTWCCRTDGGLVVLRAKAWNFLPLTGYEGALFSHNEPGDTALKNLTTTIGFSGLWVSYEKSASVWESLYKIYNKFVLTIVCIFAGTVFADLCLNYDDLIILTDDGCILAGICVIIFKIYNFHIHSERIKSIIRTVHTPVDALNHSSDLGVRALVKSCSFYEKLLLHGFWAVGATLSVALIFLVPVEEGDLPIRARYPFDVKKFPMHQIAFCLQACAVSIGLLSIIGMDSMVIGLYKWVNVQLIVLNANYENCLTSKSGRAAILLEQIPETKTKGALTNEITEFIPFNYKEVRVIDDDSFVQRFKTCIKHHQRLINSIDELNEMFGTSMFVQLFASFSMICFTGFQAVLGAQDLSSLLKFGVYLGAAFSQLLNWCWTGNALMYQSASLTTSQWLSGWEDNHTPEVISLMIISLMRSKKPLRLTAGKFYTMSMESFIAILRSSYSFFALLTEINVVDQ